MTYPLIVLPFLVATVVVVLTTAGHPRFARRMGASAIAAGILVTLTAVFDNVMIAAGLFDYPEALISGVRVGLAPVEDFAYPVCAAFLVPAVGVLLSGRNGSARGRSAS
ncbi:lycopene cyclase domain-containing protein [Microbacterium timonense]|uniref:lycopene cyclase domain-containing protein n=1 Tax=Microbacterium timonense TaxID=2086576 RepID=UPI000D0E9277|nr:lycopene cyclase domain-containing protein [Microbacterium timonense]